MQFRYVIAWANPVGAAVTSNPSHPVVVDAVHENQRPVFRRGAGGKAIGGKEWSAAAKKETLPLQIVRERIEFNQ